MIWEWSCLAPEKTSYLVSSLLTWTSWDARLQREVSTSVKTMLRRAATTSAMDPLWGRSCWFGVVCVYVVRNSDSAFAQCQNSLESNVGYVRGYTPSAHPPASRRQRAPRAPRAHAAARQWRMVRCCNSACVPTDTKHACRHVWEVSRKFPGSFQLPVCQPPMLGATRTSIPTVGKPHAAPMAPVLL